MIEAKALQGLWEHSLQVDGGRKEKLKMQAGSESSVAAVGGSSIGRAFIRGKMYNKNGVVCLTHHLQAKNFLLRLYSYTSFSSRSHAICVGK